MDDYSILRSNFSRSHQTRLDYLHLIHREFYDFFSIWLRSGFLFPFSFFSCIYHLFIQTDFLMLGFCNYDPNIAYFKVCFGNSGLNKANVLVCVDPKYKALLVCSFKFRCLCMYWIWRSSLLHTWWRCYTFHGNM
jgi:hypothetical protein